MPLSDQDKRKLLTLGLATGGGAGAGALIEYLLKNRVTWKGPTGGALAGGGGYLALSPEARDAVRKFVGHRTPEELAAERVTLDRKKLPAAIVKVWREKGEVPNAADLRKELPHLPVAEVKQTALDLMGAEQEFNAAMLAGDHTKAQQVLTDATNIGETAWAGLGLTGSLAERLPWTWAGRAAPALSGASKFIGVPAMSAATLYDASKLGFYNPETGEWSGDIGKNIKGTKETFLRGGGKGPLPVQMARSTFKHGASPVRSIATMHGAQADIALEGLKRLRASMDIAKKTGEGVWGGIEQMLRSTANIDRPLSPSQLAAIRQYHTNKGN